MAPWWYGGLIKNLPNRSPVKNRKDHTTIRNGCLFCTHCGASLPMVLPMQVDQLAYVMKKFSKEHKNCLKTWEPEQPNQSWPWHEKAVFWWYKGEHGTSSVAMWYVLGDRKDLCRDFSHPVDPDDFRRCYLLLEMVPEWKEKLHLMSELSPVWSNLVDNWEKLTCMLEEQMQTHKTNGMYEFMKSLGC